MHSSRSISEIEGIVQAEMVLVFRGEAKGGKSLFSAGDLPTNPHVESTADLVDAKMDPSSQALPKPGMFVCR